MYSFALTFQVLGKYAQAIPRVFLVILGTVVYVVLSIVGASHFESWLDTLLVLLSYWLAIFSTVLLEEHFIFRRRNWLMYQPDDYDKPEHLPLGLAALFAAGCGVMGAVLGMATQWYVGVLGRKSELPSFVSPSNLIKFTILLLYSRRPDLRRRHRFRAILRFLWYHLPYCALHRTEIRVTGTLTHEDVR